MKNHLIIFIAFQQTDIIKLSFDSISKYDIADFFVIENRSENSEAIEEYFSTKNLAGYIQFNENIANSAVSIFVKDYWDYICQYQYVTITDGDLYVHNVDASFREILYAFHNPEVAVSSSDLWQGNNHENPTRLSLKEYLIDSYNNTRQFDSIEGNTGGFLITIQNKHLFLIQNMLFVDSYLSHKVNKSGLRWYKTNKNLAYHLTWDLYIEGHPYYEWKKQVYNTIWFEEKFSEYKKIR